LLSCLEASATKGRKEKEDGVMADPADEFKSANIVDLFEATQMYLGGRPETPLDERVKT